MHHGISAPNAASPAELVALAVDAERAGWDGFFLWDHLQFIKAAGIALHDPTVLLGAIAQVTSTIRIGAIVTPVPRRRPWKLAKEITTLDHLSGGRVILGVGLGWPPDDEFACFGEPAKDRERAERLDEGLAIIAGLWTGEPFSYDGRHFTVDAARMLPTPLQQPRPPIWVAAMSNNSGPYKRAARWDGIVPIHPDGIPLPPADVAAARERCVGAHPGFDLVASAWPGVPTAEYADAGATWLLESCGIDAGWIDGLRRRLLDGPPA